MTTEAKTKKAPESPLNLYQKINWVRGQLTEIAFDKTVGEGSYGYAVATHAAVNRALKPLLVEAGLVDCLSLISTEAVDTGLKQGKGNRSVIHVRGQYTYSLINVDEPAERLEVQVDGWGEDSGDKGPGKAYTYAFKAARAKVFSISTGDGEEDRNEEVSREEPTLSPEQVSALLEKADGYWGHEGGEKKIKGMCERVFKVKDLKEIYAKHFESAMAMLDKRAQQEMKADPDDQGHAG
jgi:ERF superfamily